MDFPVSELGNSGGPFFAVDKPSFFPHPSIIFFHSSHKLNQLKYIKNLYIIDLCTGPTITTKFKYLISNHNRENQHGISNR
jgi:hypothetical protein